MTLLISEDSGHWVQHDNVRSHFRIQLRVSINLPYEPYELRTALPYGSLFKFYKYSLFHRDFIYKPNVRVYLSGYV